ncbi:MAG: ABC transporter permease [Candidatus Acidiferrum sp.]
MPDWKSEIRQRLRGLRLSPERESEILDELSSHLQDRYDELCASGLSQSEARRNVVAELDFTDLVSELQTTEVASHEPVPQGAPRTGHFFSDFLMDLRYAARTLRKSPGFTTVAILTLALGIGANAAVFTVINSLILNPLPVDRISTLVALNTTQRKQAAQLGDLQLLSIPNFRDLRNRTNSFASFAAHSNPAAVTIIDKDEPHRAFMELVTANYFATLGLQPALGRFFLPDEDTTSGMAPVAVLGYSAWQNRFGGRADIVGQSIKLNNVPFTIIGVGPKDFKGLYAVFGPDLWVPFTMARQFLSPQQQDALTDRSIPLVTGIARLRDGNSFAQVQAEMKIASASLDNEFPDSNSGQSLVVRHLTEAAYGPERQGVVWGSMLLAAIVGIVLLIACSNVANLLLARAAARRQEIAVRMALGAGRTRLVRQLLTESVTVSLFSGILGFLFGYGGCQLLSSLRPAEYAQNLAELRIGPVVFGFTFIVAILTGLIFGIVPALRTSRTSVSEVIKEETRTAGRRRGRFSFANILLGAQVAGSLVLLVIAAIFLHSIQQEYTIDPGYQTKHLAIFMLYPGQAGYDQPHTEQFYKQVRDRISSVPGISSLSWASNMPLWGRKETGLLLEGQEQRKKSDAISAVVNTVDLDYFSTLGISFVAGRDFIQDDRDGSTSVAIINDTMAAQYWPNQNALGRRLQLPQGKNSLQVVGIVKASNYQTLGESPQPCVFIPLRQNFSDGMILYVRSEQDPNTILAGVRDEIHRIDPALAVEDIRTGTKIIDQALWWGKIAVNLLTVFGFLAVGLASVGLYGIMAYSVNQRRREIGVRMALGANQETVWFLILRQGMTMVLGGLAAGVTIALLVGRGLSRFLYGVKGTDYFSLAGASLTLLLVALIACYLPARSASRVDPLVALRDT